jgi:DNA-directed RNA polymerase specialized sigma24 family protein
VSSNCRTWPTTLTPDPADQHVDRDALITDMARLPPKQRAVIVLRYYGAGRVVTPASAAAISRSDAIIWRTRASSLER